MAIQMRRGPWSQFDPTKMLPGEWAVILSGHPTSSNGMALYHCFAAGVVKQICTFEDAATIIANATEEVAEQFTEDLRRIMGEAEDATSAATLAANAANAATTAATTATSAANSATTAANTAAQNANTAAENADTAAANADATADGVESRVQEMAQDAAETATADAEQRIQDAIDAMGDISELAVPLMSADVRGGAKLEEHGGLVLRDESLGIGNLVQESDGYSRGGLAEVTAEGHAEQFSTTGKNLINIPDSSGVADSYQNYFKEFTVSRGNILNSFELQPGTTYTLSFDIQCSEYPAYVSAGVGNGGYTTDISGASDSSITEPCRKHITFTPTEENLSNGSVFAMRAPRYGNTNTQRTYSISEVQLELGSTATEYEPYTGGAPSPSPEFPQAIEVVSGRNLCREAITVSNSAQYTVALVCDIPELLPNTNYMLSFDGAAGNKLYTNEEISIQRTFTVPSDGHVVVEFTTKDTFPSSELTSGGWKFLKNYTGNTVTPSFSNVQLTLGSTPQPYVPYGHVGMEVQGKNLLPLKVGTTIHRGITWQMHSDGSISGNGTSNGGTSFLLLTSASENVLKRERTYTMSSDSDVIRLGRWFEVGGSTEHAYRNLTFTVPESGDWNVTVNVPDAVTLNNETIHVMIVEGQQAEPYHPPFHTTTPIPLPSRGWVGSLPDGTADVLTLDGAGKVTWELVDEEVTFDGSSDESWSVSGNSKRVNCMSFSDYADTAGRMAANVLCTYFRAGTTGNTYNAEGTYCSLAPIDAGIKYISFTDGAGLMTIAAWTTWLSTHNVTVLYPLATPVTEDLGYIDPPSINGDCTISIPELDALGVRYFVDDSVTEYGRQMYARAYAELGDAITELAARVAALES